MMPQRSLHRMRYRIPLRQASRSSYWTPCISSPTVLLRPGRWHSSRHGLTTCWSTNRRHLVPGDEHPSRDTKVERSVGRLRGCEAASPDQRAAPNTYEDALCQETNSPRERFFAFFPLSRAWRRQPSVRCPDVIAVCWCQRTWLPQTLLEVPSSLP